MNSDKPKPAYQYMVRSRRDKSEDCVGHILKPHSENAVWRAGYEIRLNCFSGSVYCLLGKAMCGIGRFILISAILLQKHKSMEDLRFIFTIF